MDGGVSSEENGTETPRAVSTCSQQEEAGWEMVEHDIPEVPASVHRAPPLGKSNMLVVSFSKKNLTLAGVKWVAMGRVPPIHFLSLII